MLPVALRLLRCSEIGVEPTPAESVLYDEARILLAGGAGARPVAAAAGTPP